MDFPTTIWFESDYSVYTMRQASRGLLRIGRTKLVKVVFIAYRNSLQADALKLVAKKLQPSLAAYGDDGDDLMLALARKIVSGEEDDAQMVESVFGQVRDDDWKQAMVKPKATPRNGNGNAHHTDGIGPSVELVLGNGHAGEPEEGQQSLFSRTEFMAEEPMKPRPSSLSLFEWAFSLEQEQELVGVGR